MPTRKQALGRGGSKGRRDGFKGQSVLRGVTDELGLTDPETGKRAQRKGPIRVSALRKRQGGDSV